MGTMNQLITDIYGPKTNFTTDLVSQDLLLPSFELGQREPYLFSKKMYEMNKKKYYQSASEVARAAFQYPGGFLSPTETFINPNNFLMTCVDYALLYVHSLHGYPISNIRMLNLSPG